MKRIVILLIVAITSMHHALYADVAMLSRDSMCQEIADSSSISVARVSPYNSKLGSPPPGSFYRYGPFLALDAEQSAYLRKIMSKSASYEDGGHRCPFSPGYVIRFTDADGILEILLCFGCHDYSARRGEKVSGYNSFAPSADQLFEFLSKLPVKEAQ